MSTSLSSDNDPTLIFVTGKDSFESNQEILFVFDQAFGDKVGEDRLKEVIYDIPNHGTPNYILSLILSSPKDGTEISLAGVNLYVDNPEFVS